MKNIIYFFALFLMLIGCGNCFERENSESTSTFTLNDQCEKSLIFLGYDIKCFSEDRIQGSVPAIRFVPKNCSPDLYSLVCGLGPGYALTWEMEKPLNPIQEKIIKKAFYYAKKENLLFNKEFENLEIQVLERRLENGVNFLEVRFFPFGFSKFLERTNSLFIFDGIDPTRVIVKKLDFSILQAKRGSGWDEVSNGSK